MEKTKRSLKRLGVISLVLAQIATAGVVLPTSAGAFAASAITRNMENLDRGVVAMMTENGVYLSWRRLGTESADTNFEVYRNKEKITEGAITNYTDPNGTINDYYTIVCNGTMSDSVPVLDSNYIEIPLQNTPDYEGDAVTSRDGITYGYYAPGDGSYGDLDGDGEYEIVFLWNPSDAKDAASGGRTGKVYMDAYKLDGTFMWRIDMGWNIRAGAHDTQLCIADFDGDGASEVMTRTADGTTDAAGNVIGDASRGESYESSWAALNGGKNLQGPLYVTVFDGETGVALDTTDYYPNNVAGSTSVSLSFGDDFGNRSERYNATIAYLDGQNPSGVFARGYYMGKNGQQRMGCAAYDYRNGELTMRWSFDTADSANAQYVGNGNHNIEAADLDGDGKDEVCIGALAWDDDGGVLWCTNLGHGDAMHIGDFTPENEGLEVLTAHEEAGNSLDDPLTSALGLKDALGMDPAATVMDWGITLQSASTGKFIQAYPGIKDTGRGIIANIGYGDSYYVMWGAASTGYHDNKGNDLGNLGLAMNGRIYWDGDLQDELQDHRGAGQSIVISKWNDDEKKVDELFVPEGTHSINSTKGNTNGQADLIGDWREEFVTYVTTGEESETEHTTVKGSFNKDIEVDIVRTKYQYALRIYTTNIPTDYNFYTLSHDDVYRNSSGAYNNCYNQPPHISWYMNDAIEGSQYTTQPDANVKLVSNNYTAKSFDAAALPDQGSGRVWNPGGSTTGEGGSGDVVQSSGLGYFYDCIDHWSRANIDTLYSKGIVDGVSGTTYTATVGEFLKVIVSSLGLPVGESADTSNWAAPYYAAALKAGIIPDGMDLKASQLNDEITDEQMEALLNAAAEYSGGTAGTGLSNNLFYPDNTITTGEFLKMIVASLGLQVGEATDPSNWAAPYYAAAMKAGIIPDGMDLKANELNDIITREEMAALVSAAAEANGKTVDSTPVEFTDADSISAWAVDYVYEAANLGIIDGYEDSTFRPQGTATRAEACAMLARLITQL